MYHKKKRFIRFEVRLAWGDSCLHMKFEIIAFQLIECEIVKHFADKLRYRKNILLVFNLYSLRG